jgi:hypothetical protein
MAFPANAHRFLYANLLTASNVTPNSVATGFITQGIKEIGIGGAIGRPGGAYSGLVDREWVVEIDSVAGGAAIGQATFRYSTDGGATWAASGQATNTTAVALTLGVTFAWIAAVTGADFAPGDRWRFKTILPRGLDAALDFQDRNRSYRTLDVTGMKTLDIDLGAPAPARCAMLLDHNFTSSVTVTVKGNVSASWGTPPVNEVLAYAAQKMGAFFTGGSYRHWRIELTDAANGAGYLDVSTLFLGDYLELSTRKLSHVPWGQRRMVAGLVTESEMGYRRQTVEAVYEEFPLRYDFLAPDEYDALVAMRDAVWDASARINRPLIFVPDAALPSVAYLCYLDPDGWDLTGQHPTGYAGELLLREVARL